MSVELKTIDQSLTFDQISFILNHQAFDDTPDAAKMEIFYVAGYSAGFMGCSEDYLHKSDSLLKTLLVCMKDARACFSEKGQTVTEERVETWDEIITQVEKWIEFELGPNAMRTEEGKS